MVTSTRRGWRLGKIETTFAILLVLGAMGEFYGWSKFFREVLQPDWITSDPEMRFK